MIELEKELVQTNILCDKALEEDPLSVNLLKKKIWCLKQLQNYEEAKQKAKFATIVFPQDLYFYFLQIKIIYKRQNYTQNDDKLFKEIMKIFDEAIKKNQTNQIIRFQKGQFLEDQQKNQDALNCYDQAQQFAIKNNQINLTKRNLLNKLGHQEQTLSHPELSESNNSKIIQSIFIQNIEKNCKKSQNFGKKLFSIKLELLQTLNLYSDAQKLFEQLISNFPNDIPLYISQSKYLLKYFQFLEALQCIDQYELKQFDEDIIRTKCEILRSMNNYQAELDYLNQMLIKFSNNFEALCIMKITHLIHYQQFEEAINYSKIAIQQIHNPSVIYAMLGKSLQERNQFKNALEYYEKAIEHSPQLEFHLQKAQCLQKLGLMFESIKFIKQSLITFPFDLQLSKILAHSLIKISNLKEAQNICQQLIQNDPNNLEAILLSANILQQSGAKLEALKTYQKILQLDEFCVQNYLDYSQFLENDFNKRAVQALNIGLVKVPYSLELHRNLGKMISTHKSFNEAIQYFEKAINLGLNSDQLFLDYINCLNSSDLQEQALEVCDKFLSKAFNQQIFEQKSMILSTLEREDEALEYTDQEIVKNPYNSSLYLIKGVLLSNVDMLEKANNFYNFAIKLFPFNYQFLIKKAYTLAKQENYIEAFQYYDRALSINPHDEIWFEKGNLLKYLKQYHEADQCYNQAIKINPMNSEVYLQKIKVLIKQNEQFKALSCSYFAMKFQEEQKHLSKLVGRILKEMNDFKSVNIIARLYFKQNPNEEQFKDIQNEI